MWSANEATQQSWWIGWNPNCPSGSLGFNRARDMQGPVRQWGTSAEESRFRGGDWQNVRLKFGAQWAIDCDSGRLPWQLTCVRTVWVRSSHIWISEKTGLDHLSGKRNTYFVQIFQAHIQYFCMKYCIWIYSFQPYKPEWTKLSR